MPDMPIGHLIRGARKKARMTQTALANAMGVSVSYINLVERDRRRLNESRLNDAATILDIDPNTLDGDDDRRLLIELETLSAGPAVADLPLDAEGARKLITENVPWARALVALHHASQRDQSVIAAYSDRLNQDPVLSESIHEMLNASTAIRSVASIIEDAPDLTAAERGRFDAILGTEAARMADVAQSLAGFFERNETLGSAATAAEEVDDLLYEHRNHFPAIEAAMELTHDKASGPTTETLAEMLFVRGGIEIRRVPLDMLPATAHRLVHFDPYGKRLTFAEGLPRCTERFEMARRIAEFDAQNAVDDLIANSNVLTSDNARDRARRALFAYAAGALVMPYVQFHETAERLRYDIDALAMMFDASPEQLCHRFTTLRRPGAEGVPFAFLRANAAGFLTKRFPLPRLPIPRFGGACPLWAVYAAMQTPDLRQRQLAEFPNGDRFFILARATRPVASAHGQTLPSYALMLACDVLNADRLVYSDGLDLSPGAHAEPVGPTCLLCARELCAHRQEASIRTRV